MDKSEALWKELQADRNYTKSYGEFLTQFSTPEKINALYLMMKSDGHYTKTVSDFQNQFFTSFPKEKDPEREFGTINIKDNRDIDPITGIPLKDTNRLHSSVDQRYAKHVIEKAKEYGVDPYTALAINMQETGFSDEHEDNPFAVILQNPTELALFQKDPVDYSMKVMKGKAEVAKRLGKKTEAEAIQAWNGYGMVRGAGNKGKMYGIDTTDTPIDTKKNPVYGKRVVDIRDNILKKNPDIVKLVNESENNLK